MKCRTSFRMLTQQRRSLKRIQTRLSTCIWVTQDKIICGRTAWFYALYHQNLDREAPPCWWWRCDGIRMWKMHLKLSTKGVITMLWFGAHLRQPFLTSIASKSLHSIIQTGAICVLTLLPTATAFIGRSQFALTLPTSMCKRWMLSSNPFDTYKQLTTSNVQDQEATHRPA